MAPQRQIDAASIPEGLAPDDGADVIARFEYQHAVGANLLIGGFTEDTKLVGILAERGEDLVALNSDGTMSFWQVKTRKDAGKPFPANEVAIRNTISRFAEFETKYSDRISAYHIATNIGFLTTTTRHRDLAKLTGIARQIDNGESLDDADQDGWDKWIENLDLVDSTEGDVVRVMVRLKLHEQFMNMGDEIQNLSYRLATKLDFGKQRLPAVATAAYAIIDCVRTAAKYPYDLIKDPTEAITEKSQIEFAKLVLEKGLVPVAEAIKKANEACSSPPIFKLDGAAPLGKRTARHQAVMETKLHRGEISLSRIDNLKNLTNSAEEWLLQLAYRDEDAGVPAAFYQHAGTLLRGLAEDAQYKASAKGKPYGTDMLHILREDLRIQDPSRFGNPDMDPDILLGIVGLLTQECKVWWSEEFEVVLEEQE